MNVTKNCSPRKEAIRLRPSHDEGLNIQYHLKRKRLSFVRIGECLGVSHQMVVNVVSGRRRSARIESEIARILGKADWNEVVLEARAEVQKKPVAVIVREMQRERDTRLKAAKKSLSGHISQRMGEIEVTDLRSSRGRKGA